MSVVTDVLPFILKNDDCWFWLRGHGGNGRPYWRNQLVYRLLYQFFRGEIPSKRVLDHVVCNNPRCINPWHVEPRTQKQNLARVDIKQNFGVYVEKGNLLSGQNLGDYLARKGRQRNARGQFVGG